MNQPKFLKQYVYALASDFKAENGTPAKWAPNMPSHWGSESKCLKLNTKVSTFALSADDCLLAVGVENAIHIYDVNSLELRQVLEGHSEVVRKMEFAPKSRIGYSLVSSSENRGRDGTIIWWDLDDQGKDTHPSKPVDVVGIAKKASDYVLETLQWSGGSETSRALEENFKTALAVAVAKKGLEGRAILHGSFAGFGSEVFSKDGKYLFTKLDDETALNSLQKCAQIWDAETRAPMYTLRGHTDSIMWIGASQNSEMVASVAWDGTVRIWSIGTGQCLHSFGNFGGQMWAGAWSPNSKYLAFSQGSPRTVVFVYEVRTGREISRFEEIKHWARSMDWSPDGRLLASGASSGLVCVWDAMTGEQKMKWELKFDDPEKMMMNFISTGSVKFIGSKLVFQTTEGTVEVYDFHSNSKCQFTRGPRVMVKSMVYDSMKPSHNAKFLVSADADNSVRIWSF